MNYITKGELIQLLQENHLPDSTPVTLDTLDSFTGLLSHHGLERVSYRNPRTARPIMVLKGYEIDDD